MSFLKKIIYGLLFLINIINFNLFGMSRVLVRFASAPTRIIYGSERFFDNISGTDYPDDEFYQASISIEEDEERFMRVRGLFDKLKIFFNNEGSNIKLLSLELSDQATWFVKMNFDSLEILLKITFPLTFPFDPPFIRVVDPVLLSCQCISESGAVCCPLLTPLGWNMGASFKSVLLELFKILSLNELNINLYTDNVYNEQGALSDFKSYLRSIGF